MVRETEMFGYVSAVLQDMLKYVELSWHEFSAYRRDLKVTLGAADGG